MIVGVMGSLADQTSVNDAVKQLFRLGDGRVHHAQIDGLVGCNVGIGAVGHRRACARRRS